MSENKKDIYIVFGNINESGDVDIWVEALFDDKKQAMACSQYLNYTKTQDNVEFYASPCGYEICEEDYIQKIKDYEVIL